MPTLLTPRRRLPVYVLACLLCYTALQAQVGNPDPLFGIAGLQTFNKLSSINGTIVKVLPQASGISYVVYKGYNQFGQNKITVIRYLTGSVIDSSYGGAAASVSLMGTFADALIQLDGKLIIAANAHYTDFSGVDVHDDIVIARYNLNGSADISFGSTGTGYILRSATLTSYDYARSLSLEGTQIVVAENFYSVLGGYGAFQVEKINSSGIPVSGFWVGPLRHTNTSGPYDDARGILGAGGKTIVVGSVRDSITFKTNFSVYRYNSNGTFDSTFNNTGKLTTSFGGIDIAYAAAIQNGRLVVAGSTTNSPYGSSFAIARYLDNGTPDSSFNGTGRQIIHFDSNAVASQLLIRDNKIIIAGNHRNKITRLGEYAICRLNINGLLDPTFDGDGKQTLGRAGTSFSLTGLLATYDRLLVPGLSTQTVGGAVAGIVGSYIVESAALLPLQLLDFTGAPLNGMSELKWQTADEVNVSHFTIERRDPTSNHFSTIIDNISVRGQRNNSYTIFDKRPLPGDNFYRLKMTDRDGQVSYSKVVRIHFEEKLQLTVYPNPATDFIYVKSSSSVAGAVQVTIYDAGGKRVLTQAVSSGNERISVNLLPKGYYLVEMVAGKVREVKGVVRE